jgi:hypothetical protein
MGKQQENYGEVFHKTIASIVKKYLRKTKLL